MEIDIIYCTEQQHDEFYKWVMKFYETEFIIEFMPGKYEKVTFDDLLYFRNDHVNGLIPLLKVPKEIKKWLSENCTLNFIHQKLQEMEPEEMGIKKECQIVKVTLQEFSTSSLLIIDGDKESINSILLYVAKLKYNG